MAVLNAARPHLRAQRLPGSGAVLAAHAPALPQPDQLCGPFAAAAALAAVVGAPPSVADLAAASGTRIWPHDVAEWRPAGAPLDRTGWDRLPVAGSPEESGTDATGLAAGVARVCPGVAVVPASGPGGVVVGLVRGLVDLELPLGLVANLRTGPVAPDGLTWDVGHYVLVWGLLEDHVAIADSYRELGAPKLPPGSRLVPARALEEALVGRGLLLLVDLPDAERVTAVVRAAGFATDLWAT